MPYPLALALTLAVEVPIYTGALRVAALLRGWRAVAVAVGVNLLTHPLLWYLLDHPGAGLRLLLAAETVAWLAETVAVWCLVRRSIVLIGLIALVANTGSLLAGVLIAGVGPG